MRLTTRTRRLGDRGEVKAGQLLTAVQICPVNARMNRQLTMRALARLADPPGARSSLDSVWQE